MNETLLYKSPPNTRHEIRTSSLCPRGWTYQKQPPARWKIYFPDHQIRFQCDGIRTKAE